MKLVIFLGAPGVGKGTQCSMLSARLGYRHISTGSIIRNEIQSKSELGLRVKEIVESGNLVDDQTIFLCLEKALNNLNCPADTTILLDGLPRNISQGKQLDILIQKMSFENTKVICFTAETENLVRRVQSRLTCSSCSQVESVPVEKITDAYLASHVCKSCQSVGTLFRRRDDEASTVKHRLDLYQTETYPLISFYQERKMISFVDGLMPPEFVYVRVASYLI